MQTDVRGLQLTTTSAAAAKHIDAAVTGYLDYSVGASASLKKALDEDPGFALAQCFRAYFMMMLEMRSVLPKVKQTIDDLKQRLSSLTRREQLHVAALEAWADGDIIKACAAWEVIITEHPRDILAMKLHHTLSFYMGQSQVMRSVLAGAIDEWDDATPGYSYVQGMYAYALEECAEYNEAERWGRAAAAGNPGDLWAIHSVAHVLEMQERTREGLAWLPYTAEQWAQKNPFKAHVWWHGALFAMAEGDTDRVLAIYDNELSSVNTDNYVDVSNQGALLKRLELMGVDVGDRWHTLAAYSKKRIHDHMLPFRDIHFGLCLAGDGDLDTAREHIQSMRTYAAGTSGWQAESMTRIAVPLCEAIVLAAEGKPDKAAEFIWPIRHEFSRIGGSNAQRDLFAQILCDAAVRGNKHAIARSLLAERVKARPERKANWSAYADVLAALGETKLAQSARTRAVQAEHAGA
jgi:tetratricopeptide (TPR) repeat protein